MKSVLAIDVPFIRKPDLRFLGLLVIGPFSLIAFLALAYWMTLGQPSDACAARYDSGSCIELPDGTIG